MGWLHGNDPRRREKEDGGRERNEMETGTKDCCWRHRCTTDWLPHSQHNNTPRHVAQWMPDPHVTLCHKKTLEKCMNSFLLSSLMWWILASFALSHWSCLVNQRPSREISCLYELGCHIATTCQLTHFFRLHRRFEEDSRAEMPNLGSNVICSGIVTD